MELTSSSHYVFGQKSLSSFLSLNEWTGQPALNIGKNIT